MAEVLVLVDHTDGAVKKVTAELLTFARRLGEPAAVFVGPGFDTARETLARHGAGTVYVADAGEVGSAGAWSKVESFEAAPPRQAGTVVTDDGEGADKLLEFLASKKFV